MAADEDKIWRFRSSADEHTSMSGSGNTAENTLTRKHFRGITANNKNNRKRREGDETRVKPSARSTALQGSLHQGKKSQQQAGEKYK